MKQVKHKIYKLPKKGHYFYRGFTIGKRGNVWSIWEEDGWGQARKNRISCVREINSWHKIKIVT